MTGAGAIGLASALRRLALPLASYYALTLGVPLANGAARSGAAFARHALVVLAVPLIAIVLACTARAIAGAAGRVARDILTFYRSDHIVL